MPAEARPSASGIELVSLADGWHELLVSIAEIAAIDPHPGMADATHYLNHLTFAPSGERFCVFHIWQESGGAAQAGDISCSISMAGWSLAFQARITFRTTTG